MALQVLGRAVCVIIHHNPPKTHNTVDQEQSHQKSGVFTVLAVRAQVDHISLQADKDFLCMESAPTPSHPAKRRELVDRSDCVCQA